MSASPEHIARYLARLPDGLTATEIATGVRARAADVRRVLHEDERFCGPLPVPGRSPKAQRWILSVFAPDESGRVAGPLEEERDGAGSSSRPRSSSSGAGFADGNSATPSPELGPAPLAEAAA